MSGLSMMFLLTFLWSWLILFGTLGYIIGLRTPRDVARVVIGSFFGALGALALAIIAVWMVG